MKRGGNVPDAVCAAEVTECAAEVTECAAEVTECAAEVTECAAEVTECAAEAAEFMSNLRILRPKSSHKLKKFLKV